MDSNNLYGWKAEELRDDLDSKSNSSKEENKEEVKEGVSKSLSYSMPPKSYMPMLHQNQGQDRLVSSFVGGVSKPLD